MGRGVIYAIQAGENGPIKFGYSADSPKDRLISLQTAHYLELRLLHVNEGDLEEEKQVHKICRQERIRGEWFEPEGNALLVLKAMAEDRLRPFLLRVWTRNFILTRGPLEGETVNGEFWEKRKQMVNDPDLPSGEVDLYEYHWYSRFLNLLQQLAQPLQKC